MALSTNGTRGASRRAHQQRGGRLAWLALLLVGVAAACGTTDSRDLSGPAEAGQDGTTPGMGGAKGGSTGGGKGGSTGGTHASGSGGTRAQSQGGDVGTGADAGAGAEGGSVEVCGNGHREGSEECDDGNEVSGDGCDSTCQSESSGSAICGNGIKESGEACDDGNVQPGDGCDAECRVEQCGNNVVDAGEQCDPPKAGSCTDHCNFVSANCGNGKVEGDEECDDGNDVAGDGCFECRKECGDGKIDAAAGEQCEPAYNAPKCKTDCHCGPDCRWLPICGDGIVQADRGEQCDPSNGVTCVACMTVTPQSCDGEGGCGGAPDTCVPDGSGGPVTNGTFDTTVSGWTPSDSRITAAVVNDGSPAPDALEVTFATGDVRAEAGAYQCVPVHAGVKYEFEAHYFIPADAPDGVGAAAVGLLYAGTQCAGTLLTAYNGPQGLLRDAWSPYSFQIDTSQVTNGPSFRLLLRLDVVRPKDVDGSRVRWDTVALTEPGARCGDCHLDIGEQCDDGNHTAGDGCSADCQIEACGDGVLAPSEQCDDGNTTFGGSDNCTPGCRIPNGCDTCSEAQCQTKLDACFGLTGSAEAGPRAGTARSTLCDELLTCVRSTSCDLATRTTLGQVGAYVENCYCGTAGDDCFVGKANGSCKAQIEAALESADPSTLLGRISGDQPDYPALAAVRDLIGCQTTSCNTGSACARTPTCGDGVREDRNLTDPIMTVGGKEVPCDDKLTATGHGCSFEECDNGSDGDNANGKPGSNCDQYCLRVACGNYVTDGTEDCDDGNNVSGDGCSADCKAEYDCGNGTVEAPFEECDRGTGASPDGSGPGDVCTSAEAASNPAACACDTHCKLVVCGNDIVQPGEQCDPPDESESICDHTCHLVGLGPCQTCIEASASDGMVQATYCDVEPTCLAAEKCMIDSKCFDPVPFNCYCGTPDTGACQVPTFVPTGVCLAAIKAGATATTNADIITQMQGFDVPAGVATSILNDVFSTAPECHDLCF